MTFKISHLFVVAIAGTGSFVAASRFSASGSGVEVVEAARPAPGWNQVSLQTGSELKIGRDRIATEGTGDAFRAAAWTPPPPPPPPPAAPVPAPPPPPPTAPPLPF